MVRANVGFNGSMNFVLCFLIPISLLAIGEVVHNVDHVVSLVVTLEIRRNSIKKRGVHTATCGKINDCAIRLNVIHANQDGNL